jgi:hypothetical protein
VSAAILREAAGLMREQHGPDHERHAMWTAMAAWLDSEFANPFGPTEQAIDVAKAYLGATT